MLSTKKLLYKVLELMHAPVKVVLYSNQQITWDSTANPYQMWQKNVALSGYKPIAFDYVCFGTGGTTIYQYAHYIEGNTIVQGLRLQGTASSVTQNTMNVTVYYVKTSLVS